MKTFFIFLDIFSAYYIHRGTLLSECSDLPYSIASGDDNIVALDACGIE